MTWWAVLVTVLCSGCNLLAGLKTFEHDASVDGSDAGPAARCSAVSMMGDSFDADDIRARWPASKGVTISNGHAVLAPNENDYAILNSTVFYDFREGELSFTISDDGNVGPGDFQTIIIYSTRLGYGLLVQRIDGMLQLERAEGGTPSSLGSAPYDPAQPTHIRFTHHGTTTTFDTSHDGTSWTTATSIDNLDYLDFVRVEVSAFRPTGSSIYSAFVEDINGGTPSGSACKISTLQATFDGPALDEHSWAPATVIGGVLSVNGKLQFDSMTAVAASISVSSATIFDVTDDELVVQLPIMIDPVMNNGLSFSVAFTTLVGDTAAFLFQQDGQNQLRADKFLPQLIPCGTQPYMAASTQWVRFRHAANQLYWEYSGDRASWNPLGQANDVVGLDQALLVFTLSGTPASARRVQVDNVNVPP